MGRVFGRLIAVVALAVILPLSVNAAQPYDAKAFAEAQAAGKTVVVHVVASWCPTCAVQRPIIHAMESEAPFAALSVFDVDFDGAKDVLGQFKVRSQSTLIVFKGTAEVARSVGETDGDKIRALVRMGL
ncbi:MAG: thioredoxin family protein [Rhodospirillaceae bacterium]